MTALMMGPLRPDATDGERIVYGALGRWLPEGYQIWPELPVQGEAERKQPDFVSFVSVKRLAILLKWFPE